MNYLNVLISGKVEHAIVAMGGNEVDLPRPFASLSTNPVLQESQVNPSITIPTILMSNLSNSV